MKQQFEVGDKAIWKGGCVPGTYTEYPKGTEVEIVRSLSNGYLGKFHDGEWDVYADQLDTPTTIVTVHGNPDWKPEKGEHIGWKIIEWFPMEAYKRQSVEECFEVHGYHFGIEHVCIEDWSPASNPKYFAPVYKEAKPIEFKFTTTNGIECSSHYVSNAKGIESIHLLCRNYRGSGLDAMFIKWRDSEPDEEHQICYGHFNSGTV